MIGPPLRVSWLEAPFLATAAPASAEAANGAWPPWLILLVQLGPILLFGFFIFFWLPMQNEKRRMQAIDALKKNDRVVTKSGIYGTVLSVDSEADRIVLRIDDDKGVKLTVTKSSVAGPIELPSDRSKEKEKEKAGSSASK